MPVCSQSWYLDSISGHVPGDFGSYQLCKDSLNTMYCIIYQQSTSSMVFNNLALTGRFGVCVPKECNRTELLKYGSTILSNFSVDDIHDNCDDSPEVNTSMVGMYVTYVVLLLFFIASLIGTLVEIIGEKRVVESEGSLNMSSNGIGMYNDPRAAPYPSRSRSAKDILRSISFCFDLSTNTKELFLVEQQSFMTPFNGIRALSIVWIMLYNSVMLPAATPGVDNGDEFKAVISKNFMFSIVTGGSYAIDTFFFLSGFLVAHSVFSGPYRNEELTLRFFVGYVVRRVARNLPLYLTVGACTIFIIPKLGDGPFWFTFIDLIAPCKVYWWTNMLYVNNVYPMDSSDVCLQWTWFLSAEMQFVIISPIFMFIFRYYYKRVAIGLIMCLLVIVFVLNGVLEPGDHSGSRVTKPWLRFAPFCYGMLADMISKILQHHDVVSHDAYLESQERIRAESKKSGVAEDGFVTELSDVMISSWITKLRDFLTIRRNRVIVWFVATFIILTEVILSWLSLSSFFHMDNYVTMTSAGNQTQQVYSSIGWGLASLLVCVMLSQNYLLPLQQFLSFAPLNILSKLTMTCFVVNPVVVLGLAASSTSLPHASVVSQIESFFSTVTTTLLIAVVFHVMVERPLHNLLSLR